MENCTWNFGLSLTPRCKLKVPEIQITLDALGPSVFPGKRIFCDVQRGQGDVTMVSHNHISWTKIETKLYLLVRHTSKCPRKQEFRTAIVIVILLQPICWIIVTTNSSKLPHLCFENFPSLFCRSTSICFVLLSVKTLVHSTKTMSSLMPGATYNL